MPQLQSELSGETLNGCHRLRTNLEGDQPPMGGAQGAGVTQGLRFLQDVEAHGRRRRAGLVGDGHVLGRVRHQLDEQPIAAVPFV